MSAIPAIDEAPSILLVEDNPGDVRLVEELLRAAWVVAGSINHVSSVEDAIRRVAKDVPACILLDLSLPDAQGLGTLERVRDAHPSVPIVVLTGTDDEAQAVQAVQEGAQDYLIKGQVDGHLLGRAIRYAIERKFAEVQLSHQALHDPLTGLANRALLMERLAQALARTERRPSSVAVLFLDIDRFKTINDNFGHEVGDSVLACIGDRLRKALRPEDMASRFGGDEFVVLCEDLEDDRHVVTIAKRIGRSISEPISLEAGEVVVTTSIGIAAARGIGDQPEVLLRDADAAVYRAKDRGRDRFEFCDQRMRARLLRRSRRESELRHAIDAGELRLYYQPLVVVDDLRVRRVEALVRWEHPRLGLLLPREFIPVAEETGFIVDLGSWVLREACCQAVRWEHASPDQRSISIAVNVSPRQLDHPDFEDTVWQIVEETGAEPKNLWFEITETAFMDPAPPVLEMLGRLRELGIHLAIDDFGTGYSSLAALHRLPVDAVKIDRSFVTSAGEDGSDAIVRAIVALAASLSIDVIAEGIERPEQRDRLRALGCRYGQGFLFSRPLASDEMEALLATWSPPEAAALGIE
jgi:diguanylate cyclase (GGDEF)-like protein